MLTTLSGVTAAGSGYADTFTAEFRVRLAPSRFSGDIEPKVAAAIKGLQASPTRLTGGIGGDAAVSSNFTEALASYPAQSRAAVAQMSLVLASLFGAAVAVLILLSQLLVRRRATDMTLERARGAALTAIAFRSSLESMVVAAAACALGALVAQLVRPGSLDDPATARRSPWWSRSAPDRCSPCCSRGASGVIGGHPRIGVTGRSSSAAVAAGAWSPRRSSSHSPSPRWSRSPLVACSRPAPAPSIPFWRPPPFSARWRPRCLSSGCTGFR